MPPDPTQLYDQHAPALFAFLLNLATALGDLPAEQRAVVHLKLWEQMTFADIVACAAPESVRRGLAIASPPGYTHPP